MSFSNPALPYPPRATKTITIPTVTGVIYRIGGIDVPAGPVVITENTIVTSVPASGYVFPDGVDEDWGYTFT